MIGRSALCQSLLIAALAALAGCASQPGSGLGPRGGGGDATDDDDAVAEQDDTLTAVEVAPLPPSGPGAAPCAAPGLALCLAFDGAIADASSSSLAPETAAGVTFVPGRIGQAASFGPTSALRFAPSPAFDLPADGATIEAFVRRTATNADAVVFDDDARFSLTIDARGRVWCKSSGGGLVGATVLPTEQWVHVACVIEKGSMRAYAGGVVDAIGTGSIAPSPMSSAAVGGNAPSGEPFSGAIDSLRVFKVARSAEEIAAAANGG